MVWVAAEAGSEIIIGHYGGIPIDMTLRRRPVAAVHSVEAMADPDYRRQGVLTALGTQAHEDWANHRYELVIGLPNDKWGTRNTALGYIHLFPLVWLRFPLRLDRVLTRRSGGSLAAEMLQVPARMASRLWRFAHRAGSSRITTNVVDGIDLPAQAPALDNLWRLAASDALHAITRSFEWLNWRYGAEPSGTYSLLLSNRAGKLDGLIAYRTLESDERITGFVADLFTAPGDMVTARSLLAAALDHFDEAGAGSVLAVAAPGSPHYAQLAKHGFHPLQTGFSFEVVPLSASVDPAQLGNPAAWHLTVGDFDIV